VDGRADGRAIVTDDRNVVIGIVTASDVSRALQRAVLRHPSYSPTGANLISVPGGH
jgi:hypothetical protein